MSDGEREDEDGREAGDGRAGDLAEELRALGRGMRVPDVDGETMAERVLAQLLADAAPAPTPAPASDSTPVSAPVSAPVRGGRLVAYGSVVCCGADGAPWWPVCRGCWSCWC